MTNSTNEQMSQSGSDIAPRSAAMILNGVLGLTAVKILLAFGLFPIAGAVLAVVIGAMLVLYSGTDAQARPVLNIFGPVITAIDRAFARLKGTRSGG